MNEQINHWTEAIKKWQEYKETHTKKEMIADFEDFFGLDSDGEISKFLAWYYYDINCL